MNQSCALFVCVVASCPFLQHIDTRHLWGGRSATRDFEALRFGVPLYSTPRAWRLRTDPRRRAFEHLRAKTHENSDRTHRRQPFGQLRLDDGLVCWWVLSAGCAPLGLWVWASPSSYRRWASPSTYRRWLILVFAIFYVLGFPPFSGANPPTFRGLAFSNDLYKHVFLHLRVSRHSNIII